MRREAVVAWQGRVPSLDPGVELETAVIAPRAGALDGAPVMVLVHPFGKMGGCIDLLVQTAQLLARRGYRSVIFNQRGIGESSGSATFTCEDEVRDVRAICRWARREPHAAGAAAVAADPGPDVVLVGSSAGATVAGSALDEEGVVAGVFVGYTFGWWASWLFGRHFPRVLSSPLPKLFIQGSEDGFTSVGQLYERVSACAGDVNEVHIVPDVGHFELESPEYDPIVADRILQFLDAHFAARG